MASPAAPEFSVAGLRFPEGLRWHGGWLWFSDVAARRVVRVPPTGVAETVAEFADDEPSGLGFLPDGTLLVAMMWQRRILKVGADGGVGVHADLSALPGGWLNDMVVDGLGRAYVDHAYPPDGVVSPFRRDTDPVHPDGEGIAVVSPEGDLIDVTRGLRGPNGLVILPDGATLVVAESPRNLLTAFDVAGDGTLSGRRTFADLGDVRPDGLAVDADGGVWVGAHGTGFVRVRDGGAVTDTVPIADSAGDQGVACALGGPARRTLYMSSIRKRTPTVAALREENGCTGFVTAVRVAIGGAGWP